jgi:hypothetical protein
MRCSMASKKSNDNETAAQNLVGKTTIISRVTKSDKVYRVVKPRKRQADYVLVMNRNPKHDKAEFAKKMRELQRLGSQGKLKKVPGHKIQRSGTAQKNYRTQMQAKINKISDPKKRKEAQDRFNSSDADHKHELQLGGADDPKNMMMLDSGVNSSSGAQLMNRLKHIPDGKTVDIAVNKW